MPGDERVYELTRLWWLRASEDLDVARTSQRYPFASCFHCQQAVEKAIKAMLVFRQIDFDKTHDIGQLLSLMQKAVTPPSSVSKSLSQLTRFAVETRYPPGETTKEEMAASLEKAERFLVWMRSQLPTEI